jgi:hypothetical protein
MAASTRYGRPIRRSMQCLACIGLTWALYSFGWSFIFWAPALYLLVRRAWIALLMTILTCPLTVLLAGRCMDYAHGDIRYVRATYDIIQYPQGSLNPRARVRGFDPGCGTHNENYWLRAMAEAAAIPIMHALIGPPPGAYTGPYPTDVEAIHAVLTGGVKQSPEARRSGVIRVGTTQVQVDCDQLERIQTSGNPSPLIAAGFGSQCLVVLADNDVQPQYSAIILFDVWRGQAFAMYQVDRSHPGNRSSP